MTYFAYKCRQCGVIQFNPGINNDDEALEELFRAIKGTSMIPIPLEIHSVHKCREGEFGVSDLIGIQKRAKPINPLGKN